MASRSVTKGKDVLVPFPFDDLSRTKVRPAVCLTEPVGPHRHVVLAFITSQAPTNALDTDLAVLPSDPGFAASGLRVGSVVRLHRLMTVSTPLIMRELGRLTPEWLAQVDDKLRRLFGLT